MFFQVSNVQDIEKYFRNTYIKLKEFGDELFYISGVTHQTVVGKDQTGEDFELYLSDAHPYEVDYVLPSRAVYQNGERVTLLQRIPARQYKRGLCADNTQLVDVYTGEKLLIEMASLAGFVNKPRYVSFDDVFCKRIGKSAALNSRFSFHTADNSIRCDLRPVGMVEVNSRTVKFNKLFAAEITKLLSDCKENFKVSVHE